MYQLAIDRLRVLSLCNQVLLPGMVVPFIDGSVKDGLSDLADRQLPVLLLLGHIEASEVGVDHNPIVHDVESIRTLEYAELKIGQVSDELDQGNQHSIFDQLFLLCRFGIEEHVLADEQSVFMELNRELEAENTKESLE